MGPNMGQKPHELTTLKVTRVSLRCFYIVTQTQCRLESAKLGTIFGTHCSFKLMNYALSKITLDPKQTRDISQK